MRRCLIAMIFILFPAMVLSASEQAVFSLESAISETRAMIEAGTHDEAAKIILHHINTQPPIGQDSKRLLPLLFELAENLIGSGRFDIAESVLLALVHLLSSISEPLLDDTGAAYTLLGISRYGLGNYTQSSIDFKNSIEIFTNLHGLQYPRTVRARNGLAASYFELSRHQEAEELYISLIDDQIALTGEVSEDVAKYKHNLAEVIFELDRIEEAEELLKQVLQTLEDTVGAAHIKNANSLILLAKIRSYSGLYVDAQPLLKRALDIQLQHFQPGHPRLRYAYNVLAELSFGWGEYVTAINYWNKALETIGPHHFDAANFLISLADSYRRLGLLSNADDYIQLALEVLDSSQPHHWLMGRALFLKAKLALETDNRQEAEDLYIRGLEIVETELSVEHRLISSMLADLGDYYLSEGRYNEAADALQRSMQNAILASGNDGIMTIRPHRLLGRLALLHHDHLKCQQHLDSALRTSILYYGIEHEETAECLTEFAEYRLSINELDRALDDALRAAKIVLQHHRNAVAALTIDDALAIANLPNRSLDIACNVALRQQHGAGIERVWDQLQRSRGLVIDEMMSRRVLVAEARRLDLLDVEQNLSRATAELARYAMQGPGPESSKDLHDPNLSIRLQHRKHDSEIEKFAAENRLRDVSARMRSALERSRFDLNTVWTMMPSSSAIVAFYRLNYGVNEDSELSYVAFLKRRDRLEPEVFPLGSVIEIDKLVFAWRRSLERARRYDSEFQTDDSTLSKSVRLTGETLRSVLWDPIAGKIGNQTLVFLVPDAGISGVNFGALPVDEDRYLIDQGMIFHYLTSERDLIMEPSHSSSSRGLLIVSNPDFGPILPKTSRPRSSGKSGLLEQLFFDPLPGTMEEGLAVLDLWPGQDDVVHLSGNQATEIAVQREVIGKKVIHFATHGFFIPQEELVPVVDPSYDGVFYRNPLLLSGLALSGANQRASTLPGNADGILSAEEIAIMNLDGCEWVVLSACETGLGVHGGGEGILGLRRAFQRAGAKTVIMSLFMVNDQQTRFFIEQLYTERFVHRLSTAEAMQRTSLSILKSRREAGRRTIPVDWGDFVAVGDWR